MIQRAKMIFLGDLTDGVEWGIRCPCGETFVVDKRIEQNLEDGLSKCPSCGCVESNDSSVKENPLEEELRKSIGARDREKLEATKRLMRRQ